MSIDFGEANKQKTPEGYEECHVIIGFDNEGMLRISETDEEWEPDECERDFFVGNVQRLVFYHAKIGRPVAPIQYFIMDNFSRATRKFYHYDETPEGTLVELLPFAPGNTEQTPAHGYGFYNGADRGEVDNTGDYEKIEPQKIEPQKTADSLLSEILKKPVRTIFDRD